MNLRLMMSALGALLLTMLTACQPLHAPREAVEPAWWARSVEVDRALHALGLDVLEVHQGITGGGFPKVTVRYANRSDDVLRVHYRATWRDGAGAPLPVADAWRGANTLPRAAERIVLVAPEPRAESFTVELVSAHRLRGRAHPRASDR